MKVPKWFSYQRFSFLNGINKPRKTKESKSLPGDEVEFENEEDNTQNSQYEEPNEELRTIQQSPEFDSLQPGPSKPFKSPKKVTSCKRKINCSDNKVDKAYNIMESLWQNKMNKESRDELHHLVK